MTSCHMVCPINFTIQFSRECQPSCSDGDEESVVQGRKPGGLFRTATQAGGGDPGLRPRKQRFRKTPHRKREVVVLQLATRDVRRDTPLAGCIHCNRGQP